MGIKEAYFGLEEKWYGFWEKTPLIGAIDAIDSVIPSLLLFILVVILLIAFGAFFLLSSNQVFDAKFTIVTNDNKPVNESVIKTTLEENGNVIQDLTGRTDAAGQITFLSVKMGQEIVFDINLSKGTYEGRFTVNGPIEEQIKLVAPAISLSPVVKKIFVKTSAGFYATTPIDLAFSCANSSAIPTPAKATFSGTTAVEVTEPVNCGLLATVNNPKVPAEIISG